MPSTFSDFLVDCRVAGAGRSSCLLASKPSEASLPQAGTICLRCIPMDPPQACWCPPGRGDAPLMPPCDSKCPAEQRPVCCGALPARIISRRGMQRAMEVTKNELHSLGQGGVGVPAMPESAVRFCLCLAGADSLHHGGMHPLFSQAVCSASEAQHISSIHPFGPGHTCSL